MKELREAIKNKTAIIGKDLVIKNLLKEKLKRVYIASNCPENLRKDIKHYASLYNVEVIELNKNNEELGMICKKPFSVSVIGLR